jgi:hypothetical protein
MKYKCPYLDDVTVNLFKIMEQKCWHLLRPTPPLVEEEGVFPNEWFWKEQNF